MAHDGGGLDRRTFLVGATLAGVGLAAPRLATARATVRDTRTLGKTGLRVPDIAFGTFRLKDGDEDLVRYALDAGVTHFDTADLYGGSLSEEFLGRALGKHRDGVVVATKFGMKQPPEGLTGGHPDWVARAIDESLGRLGMDHVDLYWLHAPDANTPIGDTLAALTKLIDAGKVREIGCSNFSPAQLEEAATAAKDLGVHPFVTLQNEYSLLKREPEAEVLPTCERLHMSFVPYFPLASGLLSGKYKAGEAPPEGTRLAAWPADRVDGLLGDESMALVGKLEAIATSHGRTLLELALSWLACRPGVASVIAGATSPEQVRANAAATTAWTLSPAEMAEVDAVTVPS
jgi:aryl-alcohol dehydrogenase-like predicted oxidoreductase